MELAVKVVPETVVPEAEGLVCFSTTSGLAAEGAPEALAAGSADAGQKA